MTPQREQRPRQSVSSAKPSDPSSEDSGSSESSSSSSDSDSEDNSTTTSDSDTSSRLSRKNRKKRKRGVVTPPKSSRTMALMKTLIRMNQRNLKLALQARDNAVSATGSPASKMTTARQMCLEAMTGFEDGEDPFIPPQIYTLEEQSWTKDAIQNLQR